MLGMQAYGYSLLYLITCTVLFSLALVVSFKRTNRNKLAGFFLGGYFWSLFLAVFTAFIVYSPLIEHVPHFFRLAIVFYMMVMPFSYLYFRETLMPGQPSWHHFFLFIPPLLYVADYMPFFLLPGQEKLRIFHSLNELGVKVSYHEGWFMPSGGHYVLLYSSIIYCWLKQLQLLLRFRRLAVLETGPDLVVHRKWLGWIQISQLLYFIPPLVSWATGGEKMFLSIANLFELLATLAQGYFMLMNPVVLYGIPEIAEDPALEGALETQTNTNSTNEPQESTSESQTVPSYVDNVDDETLNRISASLSLVMAEKSLFRDPNLKIYDLSIATGFHSYKISAYFRKRLGQNFYDYINTQRLAFCRRKLDEGEYLQKTLEAIASESGFQNRTTFIRTFRKYEGITPSEYIRRLRGDASAS